MCCVTTMPLNFSFWSALFVAWWFKVRAKYSCKLHFSTQLNERKWTAVPHKIMSCPRGVLTINARSSPVSPAMVVVSLARLQQGWKLSNIVVVRQHWQLGASAYTCGSVHRAKGLHYSDLISMVLEFTMLVEYIIVKVAHLISWPHYVVLQHYGDQDQHGLSNVFLHNV